MEVRMASDIVTCLQLDKQSSGRLILVKEILSCDSSFIISCVLSDCIKNKHAVLVVTAHNSLSHYQNIGIKMNYNILKHIESGLLMFYNLGEEFINSIFKSQTVYLQDVLSKIEEMFLEMQEKNGTVNIVLDGITHLFDLQHNLKEVTYFTNEIIKIARKNNSSFVLCNCNIATEDDVSHVMANLLSHKADLLLEVENLSSGWSTEVSGHMTVKKIGAKFEDDHMFTMDVKSDKYLFKLFDRGVKLFAPGTV